MVLGGLQKLTLIDYPGHIATTVFLIGCDFRCPFCYNPEMVLPERISLGAKNFGAGPEKALFKFLKERKGLLDGVVLCGGEPTVSQDLPEFCQKIKKMGYAVKLDTNGSNPKMLEILISEKLVDYVAMDIKAPLAPKVQSSKFKVQSYDKAAGVEVNLEGLKKSIDFIKNSGVDYEFRTTVVPGLHTKEDIAQIVKDISPAKRYFLQNFQAQKTLDPKFEKVKPYSQEEMLEIQKAAAPFFDICQLR